VKAFQDARWFQQKGSKIVSVDVVDYADMGGGAYLCICEAIFKDASPSRYAVVLLADGSICEMSDPRFIGPFIKSMAGGADMRMKGGSVVFDKASSSPCGVATSFEALDASSSNTIVVCKDGGRPVSIIKFIRRLHSGPNVEAEIGRHLARTKAFDGAPQFLSGVEYKVGGDACQLANVFRYIQNDGSAWEWTQKFLSSSLSSASAKDAAAEYGRRSRGMGDMLAALHIALAKDGEGFGILGVGEGDVNAWRRGWIAQLERSLGFMRKSKLDDADLKKALSYSGAIRSMFEDASSVFMRMGAKIRQHGDFHLGQVLVSGERFYVIDFEGEPLKPYGERAIHYPALKDVAGMVRSFSYASYAAYFGAEANAAAGRAEVLSFCKACENEAKGQFLSAYFDRLRAEGAKFLPLEDEGTIGKALDVLVMEKALYELEYEINNRPDWLRIPLTGILKIMEARG
jgi:maltose alpha-D-glucosyltransferase/alpha-amylase